MIGHENYDYLNVFLVSINEIIMFFLFLQIVLPFYCQQ